MFYFSLLVYSWLQALISVQGCFRGLADDDGTGAWDYSETSIGPANWSAFYPACGGQAQSPINIPNEESFIVDEQMGTLPTLVMDYLQDDSHIEVFSPGKTVELELAENVRTLRGAGRLASLVGRSETETDDNYILLQLHFHWGEDDNSGSEHTIDSQRYPLEMHLVHYNEKYLNSSSALEHSDGLLVIGVMFEIEETEEDENLRVIAEAVEEGGPLNNSDDKRELHDFNLTNFLQDVDLSKYYLYPGSLTTPPCSEIVTWVVLKDKLKVKPEILEVFRRGVTTHNFRPLQEGNSREVINSETGASAELQVEEGYDAESGYLAMGLTFLIVLILLAFLLLGMSKARDSYST